MAEKKVTIVENFANVKAFLEKNGADKELVKFIEERMAVQEKRNEGRKTSTDKKKEETNAPLKARVLEILAEGPEEGMTATEILNNDVELFKSVQKVTAIVKILEVEKKIVKIADKRKVLIKLAQ